MCCTTAYCLFLCTSADTANKRVHYSLNVSLRCAASLKQYSLMLCACARILSGALLADTTKTMVPSPPVPTVHTASAGVTRTQSGRPAPPALNQSHSRKSAARQHMFLCLALPVLRHRRVTPSKVLPDEAVGRRCEGRGSSKLRGGSHLGVKTSPLTSPLDALSSDQSATADNDYFRVV